MASTAQDNGADAAPSMPAEPEADHTALAFVATVSSSVAALTPPDACFVCGITLTEPHHNGRCQDCWGYYRTEGKDRSMVVTEIPVTDDELDRLPDIPKATPDAFKISQKSLVVFLAYAQQADHHGRTALQMKRAERTSLRLLRTGNFITIEDHDGQAWVCFTATGKALALAHGIDLDAGKAGVDAPPSSLRAP